jgi:hypothetical protein
LNAFQAKVIDPLKTELTASIQTVTNEVAELRGKQTQLEATMNVKPVSGDPKPAAQKIPATDFAASIVEAVSASMAGTMQTLQDTVNTLKESLAASKADPKEGFRKTLSAQEVTVLRKYGDLDDSSEPTPENYRNAISMVQNDAHLSREQKGSLIGNLRAQKNLLIRTAGVN